MTGTKKNVQISEENGLVPPCLCAVVMHVVAVQGYRAGLCCPDTHAM